MSGGAEQADILSVLSLVKERWKVVSGVLPSDNRQCVCPSSSPITACPLAHPPPHKQQLFVHQTKLPPACLWVLLPSKAAHLWLGQFGVVSLCPGRAACCSMGDPKIARIAICGSAVCYRRQQQQQQCSPRARVSHCCASLGAMWGCYSLLAAWHHVLSSKEQSYIRTLQLIPWL